MTTQKKTSNIRKILIALIIIILGATIPKIIDRCLPADVQDKDERPNNKITNITHVDNHIPKDTIITKSNEVKPTSPETTQANPVYVPPPPDPLSKVVDKIKKLSLEFTVTEKATQHVWKGIAELSLNEENKSLSGKIDYTFISSLQSNPQGTEFVKGTYNGSKYDFYGYDVVTYTKISICLIPITLL